MPNSFISQSVSPVSRRRWSVVQALQAAERRLSPGGAEADGTERAILLALSDARDDRVPAFLYRNALRDGRKLAWRRRAKEFLFSPTEEDSELGRNLADGLVPEFVDAQNTPENLAVAQDLKSRLEKEVLASLGDAGRVCLEGLLEGATVAESAVTAGISVRQVRHVRSRIRAMAARLYI